MSATDLLNKKAPEFTLPDKDGKIHKLSDYKGKWVVVYFYPKDDTSGCAKEACGFRNSMSGLKEKEIVVLGISKDSPASHQQFVDKYNLNFTLLSDESKEVLNMYGAWGWKSMMGKKYQGTFRYSFLVDPEGVVKKVYTAVKPEDHAREVMADVTSLSS